jgi:hypothetical protein
VSNGGIDGPNGDKVDDDKLKLDRMQIQELLLAWSKTVPWTVINLFQKYINFSK